MTRRARPLRRRYGDRPERQRFLIYCEGERTEVSYFKGVRQELRAATVKLVLGRTHGEPYGLVQKAVDHQRRAPREAQDGYEAYDQVWCVFDVEAPEPHARLADALALAERHGVRCAVSNPCFELWLMLHFRAQSSYLTTDAACRALAECGCGYTRRTKQLDYASFRERRATAYDQAVYLDRKQRDRPLAERNPWTSVHVLVNSLFRDAA